MILSGKAKLAGVLGWPVGHSRSPRLHGFWLQQHGIDGAYLPLAVKPEDFEAVIRALPRMGFKGANVTVPHKEAALRFIRTEYGEDHLDSVARRIGAVNTLVVRDDGSIEGRNTDAFGFIENLRQGCPGFSASRGPAVVLGAGGAARAVLAAIIDEGCRDIRIVNRTVEKAGILKDIFKIEDNRAVSNTASYPGKVDDCEITVYDFDDYGVALDGAALLVNTTSLGMTGQPPLEISLDLLPTDALVTDIVYAPLMTDLLRAAQSRGNPIVDGLGMLLHQARPGFEAWFGVMPDVTDELRTFVGEL